jgi:hypothetical protein
VRWWSGRDVGLIYAGIVTVTALVLAALPDHLHRRVVLDCSTNLSNLHHRPVFVLFASAFVLSSAWGLYEMPFLIWVYGTAQRWVGRTRTVLIAAAGHVGSTLIVAGVLTWAVHHGRAARSIEHVTDVGVSYAEVCLAAFVFSRLPRLLRMPYLIALVSYFAGPLLWNPSFTALGHTCSLVLGLGLAGVAAARTRHVLRLR